MDEPNQNAQPSSPFDWLNSKHVLDQIPARLDSERSRSLWRRIESELQTAGTGAVQTYLRALFSEVTQRAEEGISDFKNESV